MARVQVPGPCRRRCWSKLGYVSIEKEPFGPPWFPCQPVAPSGVGRGGRAWCWLWPALSGVTPAESPLAGSSWAGLGIQCGTRPGTWEFPGQGRCTSCREQGPEQSEGFKNKISNQQASREAEKRAPERCSEEASGSITGREDRTPATPGCTLTPNLHHRHSPHVPSQISSPQ